MKKLGCLILTLSLVLTLCGCFRADLIEIVFHNEGYQLSNDDATTVSDIFNQSDWTDPLADCQCDYLLRTDRGIIEYSSAPGIFNNTDYEHSYRVSEADRLILNEIFARYAAQHG